MSKNRLYDRTQLETPSRCAWNISVIVTFQAHDTRAAINHIVQLVTLFPCIHLPAGHVRTVNHNREDSSHVERNRSRYCTRRG